MTWTPATSAVHLTHYGDAWSCGAPAVSGGRVTWSAGSDPSGYEDVYTWKSGDATPTLLQTAGGDNEFPQVSGDRVVWQASDWLHGGASEIYTWEAGDPSPVQVTTDGGINIDPVVSGERLVWQSQSGAGYQMVTAVMPPSGRPVTTISGIPSGWSQTPVTFSLAAGGSSAPFSTYYALNGGALGPYSVPVAVSAEGRTTISYRSTDSLGQSEATKTATIMIDSIAPVTALSGASDGASYTGPLHLSLSAQDAGSGVNAVQYSLDGAAAEAYGTDLIVGTAGSHTLEFWALDNAGNSEAPQSVAFTVTQIVKQPCSISISASPTSVRLPRPFVLSGTLSGGVNGNGCVVHVRKPGSSRWSYSSNRIAYGASGTGASWWYRYSPKARGVYSFYVTFAGDTDHLATQSNTVKVTVK